MTTLIITQFILVRSSIDFSSTTYPFPSDSLTSSSVNIDSPAYPCLYDLIGDGNCDLPNNNENCDFDGGDCCRPTCELNCKSSCKYPCGHSGYYCLVDTTCSSCGHGTCNPMSKCFSTVESIKLGILNCERNNIAHGNSSTADEFCGKDPNKTISHSFDQYGFHYPGCGLPTTLCSSYQCCTDLDLNNLTSSTCTSEPKTYLTYNKSTLSLDSITSSCIDLFQACFFNNSRESKGECCECDEGWVGKDCDVPSCFPSCAHGNCTDIDNCECDDGWKSDACDEASCSNCQNGDCIAPEVCDCFYGWNGTACDVAYATPVCVYGVATSPDVCKCFSGYTGDRCEIPVCDKCNFGWCVNVNVCECYPPYYTKDPSIGWCTDLGCDEIFGENCVNCTNSTCSRCLVGFFLNGSLCTECQSYNVHCQECNLTQCTVCASPYEPYGFDCLFPGYLEFSSKYFTVLKSNGTAEIEVFRMGPNVNKVEVGFKVVQINGRIRRNADLGYVEGRVYFEKGVNQQKIVLPVYNKFSDRDSPIDFYIILYDPEDGEFYSQNLTRIMDYTWSDKGIPVISYCILEIWDDSSQADPSLTFFSDSTPSTTTTSTPYNFKFTAFNSLKAKIFSAIFIVQVRQITLISLSDSCVFSTYSFIDPSTIYTHTKVLGSNSEYSHNFYLPRGLYTLTPYSALSGVYMKIFTNLFLQGSAIEEGIRQVPGYYNNYTMPLGNSSSTWEFVYIANDGFNGTLIVECSETDIVTVNLNEVLFANCTGKCSESFQNFETGVGYYFLIHYFHMGNSPGFILRFEDSGKTYELSEIYAVQKTSVIAKVFSISSSEC